MSNRTELPCAKGLLGLAIAGLAVLAVAPVSATTSDDPAAILVYPKVVVDTSGEWGPPSDTLLTITSNPTQSAPKQAHCFHVNSTGNCANSANEPCRTSADCDNPVPCVPNWAETDFDIFITPNQPLAWYASEGLSRGEFPIEGPGLCYNPVSQTYLGPCFSQFQCGPGYVCQITKESGGLNNVGSLIPPVANDPYIGSLTCVQFDPASNPPVPDTSATRNALTGDASIIALDSNTSKAVDVAKYNAVGFRRLPEGGNTDGELFLGGPNAEYEGCGNVVILDHFFDNATDPMSVAGEGSNSSNGVFTTELTLVPCGNDFTAIEPGDVVAQMLVFNEFEQRFSTSARVDCLYNKRISNIDTPNSNRSIFSAGVAGTIAGQTRIQGAGGAETGNGLTGVAQLFVATDIGGTDPRCIGNTLCSSAAYSLNRVGGVPGGDTLTMP